mgnify:CR=1 FL=1
MGNILELARFKGHETFQRLCFARSSARLKIDTPYKDRLDWCPSSRIWSEICHIEWHQYGYCVKWSKRIYMVTSCFKSKQWKCSCDCFSRMKCCGHLAVLKEKNLLISYAHTISTTCALPSGDESSGSKPGSNSRKGGRSAAPRPSGAQALKVAGEYMIVRKSNRLYC